MASTNNYYETTGHGSYRSFDGVLTYEMPCDVRLFDNPDTGHNVQQPQMYPAGYELLHSSDCSPSSDRRSATASSPSGIVVAARQLVQQQTCLVNNCCSPERALYGDGANALRSGSYGETRLTQSDSSITDVTSMTSSTPTSLPYASESLYAVNNALRNPRYESSRRCEFADEDESQVGNDDDDDVSFPFMTSQCDGSSPKASTAASSKQPMLSSCAVVELSLKQNNMMPPLCDGDQRCKQPTEALSGSWPVENNLTVSANGCVIQQSVAAMHSSVIVRHRPTAECVDKTAGTPTSVYSTSCDKTTSAVAPASFDHIAQAFNSWPVRSGCFKAAACMSQPRYHTGSLVPATPDDEAVRADVCGATAAYSSWPYGGDEQTTRQILATNHEKQRLIEPVNVAGYQTPVPAGYTSVIVETPLAINGYAR